ncbi:hypothetical protein [Pantoea anthophila]|uniref:hypothetical protein n=1 Tax=Pantoea anthophila TaxID=470931 RepID=UPI002DB86B25|nr:hypothetical protein [Pantoea anthophila]MEB6222038.1 hypothetical protein [Pantoea anthophila]
MEKITLLSEVEKTINNIKMIMNADHKGDLQILIGELERLKANIIGNKIKNNPLRGFSRRYAEMYNDYLNPITDVLDRIERAVDSYLEHDR